MADACLAPKTRKADASKTNVKKIDSRGRRAKKEAIGGAFVDVDKIRSGMPSKLYGRIAKKLGLSRASLAVKLGMAPRTLAARTNKILKPHVAEKASRADKIFSAAQEVFGSVREARIWMNSPQRGLENQSPIDLLDTDVGARHVVEYLSAIKYGNVW